MAIIVNAPCAKMGCGCSSLFVTSDN